MAGMGPAPKPAEQRARRNATPGTIQLPAEGRKGRVPAWPLGSDVVLETEIALLKLQVRDAEDEITWLSTARERSAARRRLDRQRKRLRELDARSKAATKIEKSIWSSLWKTPQATQWERSGWVREVAQYARHKAKAESGSLDDAKEARQLADRLGLTPLAMLRLRWEVVAQQHAAAGGRAPAKKATGSRARRQHLQLVNPPKK